MGSNRSSHAPKDRPHRMRILQLHNRYLLAGGEDAIADAEADLLAAGGHEVARLRVANPSRRPAAAIRLAGAAWRRSTARHVRDVARRFRPDVAHVHNTWYALTPSVLDALHAEGVPVVMEMQNSRQVCVGANLFRDGRVCTDCVGTHPWRGVAHACYRGSHLASAAVATTIALARRRGTWDRVTRFVAPSEAVKASFVRAGYEAARITVKPTVVPDPGPRPAPPSASTALLYAGRLSPEKGADLLVDAWRRAEHRLDGLRLEIVGDGPLRPQLEREVPPRVSLAGWLEPEELAERMRRARALLFPSQCFETFGRSIAEAFAAGLPVLATDLGGPGELARRLDGEWTVPAGAGAAWAGALPRVNDDDAIDAAGAAARALYERDYCLEAGLHRLERIYGELGAA